MNKPIRRFQLVAQALVYTGLLSLFLKSSASAQQTAVVPQSSAPVVEQSTQLPDWLLPIGGMSLLAISFGIEIYRHRCFLDSEAEESGMEKNAPQALAYPVEPPVATESDGIASYSTQPFSEC